MKVQIEIEDAAQILACLSVALLVVDEQVAAMEGQALDEEDLKVMRVTQRDLGQLYYWIASEMEGDK